VSCLAFCHGGIETLGLIGDAFKLEEPFWELIGALNEISACLGMSSSAFSP
jgi:high-affinity nickel permease